MRKLLTITLLAALATGCAGRTIDAEGKSHPNGVAYYDSQGVLHQADPETLSPETQDTLATVAGTIGVIGGIAGTALGIVALTQ